MRVLFSILLIIGALYLMCIVILLANMMTLVIINKIEARKQNKENSKNISKRS